MIFRPAHDLHRAALPVPLALLCAVLAACSGDLEAAGGGANNNGNTIDTDGDGIPDAPGTDTDGDGIPDAPGTDTDGDGVPGTSDLNGVGWTTRVPRLSHRQWENTVKDLLRLDALPGHSASFTPDPSKRFDTNIEDAKVTGGLWTDYQTAAEALANNVTGNTESLARITPANLPTDATAQATAFITEFGRRAFRRPLEQTEVDGLVGLFAQGPTLIGGEAFASGANLVIRAVLQSPYFLYRVEMANTAASGRIALSGHELATRLSYSLIGTMPSDALLDAAAAGALDTAAGLQEWANTLLQDPRANETVLSFHEQLFRIAGYGSIAKDPTLFPTFTAALEPALQEEARLFFNEITLTQGGGIRQLLTSPISFVNDELAPFYGLEGDFGAELTRVDLDPTQRAGILTQLGFLATYGTLAQSDPIHRGVLLSSNMLCRELMPPPMVLPPLPAQQPGQTNRQRVDAHTSACGAGCHDVVINPLGFAFENYDAIGQWRDTDNDQPVDAAGTYPLDGQMISFNNAIELSAQLAESPTLHNCYAGNWVEYALGRPAVSVEQAAVTSLGTQSLGGSASKALLAQLTTLALFNSRAGEDPADTP